MLKIRCALCKEDLYLLLLILKDAILSTLAHAYVQAGELPNKLNAVIQPVMASLRRETTPLLRSTAAVALAELVHLCASRTPSPNEK